jgi:predicted SprT family Zn-dependent metalloprotease
MMNLNEAFDRLNKEKFNGEIKKIPVEWNGRLTISAGHCKFNRNNAPIKIAISKTIFSSLGYPKEEIEATLVHEMCHAWLLEKQNYAGHGLPFQRKMREITGENKDFTYHSLDLSQSANVKMVCGACGMEGYRGKMPRRGRVLYHKGCGGLLTFTRVNQQRKIKVF